MQSTRGLVDQENIKVRLLQLLMKSYVCLALMVAFGPSILAQTATATEGFILPELAVGQKLQATAVIRIKDVAPPGGLPVTIASSDPSRAVFSTSALKPGSGSITIKVNAGSHQSPEFFVQGLGKEGSVEYTVSAPGYPATTDKIALGPSGFVIAGPLGSGKGRILTTPGAAKTKLEVYPALLDNSLSLVERQMLGAAGPVKLEVTTSNTAAGTISSSSITIAPGESTGTAFFQPVAAGDTTIGISKPSGFSVPVDRYITVPTKVLELTFAMNDTVVGKNLQAGNNIALVEPAPAGGLEVTLTSNEPERLLLAISEKDAGSKSITIKVAPGESLIPHYLQALAGSGKATYTASAPGYKSRTSTVNLVPAGVVLAGPNSFMRSGANPGFITKPSDKPSGIVVYTVFLDPETLRSSDLTVQPIRAGLRLEVGLKSSKPGVGTIGEKVVFEGGTHTARTQFTPLAPGVTELSVITPEDYTPSANATTLKAIVME